MNFLNSIIHLVGSDSVVTGKSSQFFLSDWRERYHGEAVAIVFPKSVDQVSKIVKICIEHNIAIVPQGGNTGLCGGSIPSDNVRKSIVLSTIKLNNIRNLDLPNNSIIVEAGCTLKELQNISMEHNKYFPLSLASEGGCTIGGNLATNAGGTQVLRYGNMRELTLGIEVVNPDGNIVDLLRTLRKDNSGYSLRDLYIGSEGTLGIITAASLKLFEINNEKLTILVALSSVEDAVCFFSKARCVFNSSLTAFELISNFCLNLSFDSLNDHKYNLPPLFLKNPWFVLMEVAWFSGDNLSSLFNSELVSNLLEKFIESGLIIDAIFSFDLSQSNSLWKLRENIPLAEKKLGKAIKHDISLPISLIARFIGDMESILQNNFPGVQIVVFGHLGDGNLHYNVFKSSYQTEDYLLSLQDYIYDLVHGKVHDFGGSISAEHGIGQLKVHELKKYKDPEEIIMMRKIKNILDPRNIMNPGKIFDA